MAILDRCPFHEDCGGHYFRPSLYGFPEPDPPRSGRCWCDAVGPLWQLPLDGRFYCRRCLRAQLRVATFPDTIKFPDG